MAAFNFITLGVLGFRECWDYQEELHASIVADKLTTKQPSGRNFFLLVEHPHVYTLGKSGDSGNMLMDPGFLEKIGAGFYRINRGGDITYHGPGQLVGYPLIDLEYYHLSVREYIFKMEEAIIGAMAACGISCDRREGATGVWIDADNPAKARKICAIGVRISRYVSMHGFALNINTDLRYFSYINPCGFSSSAVTSMERELGHPVDMAAVGSAVMEQFNLVY